MSFNYGEKFNITVFGQSHSDGLGVVIDGIPAGVDVDTEKISSFLLRRAPGRSLISTPRKETDSFEIISGIVNGKTCGAPLCAVFKNEDARSGDYEQVKTCPRPGHADYPAFIKYDGFNDSRGGGFFSGRMTAPLCFAGAVAMQLLEEKGIYTGAHVRSIGDVHDLTYYDVEPEKAVFDKLKEKELPVLSDVEDRIYEAVLHAAESRNSLGGVIECAVTGIPCGTGEPLFSSIESEISRVVFSVPGVKGIEFGNGFGSASLLGSENNDSFRVESGCVVTESNRHGGILGGLATGMPVLFSVCIKPTPTVGVPQKTVNVSTVTDSEICFSGRHDPCIVPRAVPCIEAAAALAVINLV